MSRVQVLRTRAEQLRTNADSLENDAIYCNNGGQRAAYQDQAAELRHAATKCDTQAAELEAREGN